MLGIFIIYQGLILNLIDLILFIGLIISIAGVILLVTSFLDVSPITEKAISQTSNNNPFKTSSDSNSPLKIPNSKTQKINPNAKKPIFKKTNIEAPDNEASEILQIKDYKEGPSFHDEKLYFTPNYEKPVRVTRKPKKRTEPFIDEEIFYGASIDKTEEIKQQLSKPLEVQPIAKAIERNEPSPRDIKIDINNPESLPIPDEAKSFVISKNGIVSSSEAFDNLAMSAKNDIMVEIQNLNDLDDRFLSYVPITNSRIIIEDFDISNTSYVLLISSLMRQNVLIRTLPKVDMTNLITDNLALIVSDNLQEDEGKYGAIYENNSEISKIREIFERSWNLARDIDGNLLNI